MALLNAWLRSHQVDYESTCLSNSIYSYLFTSSVDSWTDPVRSESYYSGLMMLTISTSVSFITIIDLSKGFSDVWADRQDR